MYFSDVLMADWPTRGDTRHDHRHHQASPKDAMESSPSAEQGGATGARDERARVRAKVLGKRPASERPSSTAEMSAWALLHEGPVAIGGDESGKRRRALMEWSDDESGKGSCCSQSRLLRRRLLPGHPPRQPPGHHGHQRRPGVRHRGQPRIQEEPEGARSLPPGRPVGEKAGPQRDRRGTAVVGSAKVTSFQRFVSLTCK